MYIHHSDVLLQREMARIKVSKRQRVIERDRASNNRTTQILLEPLAYLDTNPTNQCNSVATDITSSEDSNDEQYEQPTNDDIINDTRDRLRPFGLDEVPSVTPAHEKLVKADEMVWKDGRLILESELLLARFPDLLPICETCKEADAIIHCDTCQLDQCTSCCNTYHSKRHCHVLQSYCALRGYKPFALDVKNLSKCKATCTATKESLIHLVDLKGMYYIQTCYHSIGKCSTEAVFMFI